MGDPKTNALAWAIDGSEALAEYTVPGSGWPVGILVSRVGGIFLAHTGGVSLGLNADTLPEAILEAEAKLRERARRDAVEALALLRALGGEL